MSALARFHGYKDVSRLRSLGALEYLTARESASGEERILVSLAPGAEGDEATRAIEAIARAHALLDHPWVPPVAEVHRDFVALRGAAVADLDVLAETALASGYRLSPIGGPAFAIASLEMLDRAHHVTHPGTRRPLCLAVFAAANVLVSEDGRVSFLGWGHPHEPAVRARLFHALPSSFVAHEVSFGAEPQPGSDLTAAALFFHSFLHLGELQPGVVAALRGEATPGHEQLPGLVLQLLANSHAARPEDRSIPRFLGTFRLVLDDLGIVPDLERFRMELRHLVREAREHARLAVGEEARWFQLGGAEVVRLDRRGPLRRVLGALVTARRDRPDQAVSWEDLFAAGWPGERPHPESARNRVYVAVSELRAIGLRELLVRRDDGYLLAPSARIERG